MPPGGGGAPGLLVSDTLVLWVRTGKQGEAIAVTSLSDAGVGGLELMRALLCWHFRGHLLGIAGGI